MNVQRKETNMTPLKRWFCLALSLALAVTLALPAHAVEAAADSFASFLIDADTADFPEKSLNVVLYRRNGSGAFASDDSVRYSCQINRVAGDATFYIQPRTEGVWVEVDYLSDLNGDGTYEMLDGESAPVCDSMTSAGTLEAWNGTDHTLSNGQIYLLSAQTLRERAQAILQERVSSGSSQYLGLGSTTPNLDSMLYFVTLHYVSPTTKEEYSLSYYLQLFDSVIVPSDVPFNAWYYSSVEYALENGLFSGTGKDSFSPNSAMTRSMLWVVLANVEGATLTPGEYWYSGAQSWVAQEGISDGSDPNGAITREQLALMLYNLAGIRETDPIDHLSGFSDRSSISPWAEHALNWAVGQGLFSGGDGGILNPRGTATRAEVATVLRQYEQLVVEK